MISSLASIRNPVGDHHHACWSRTQRIAVGSGSVWVANSGDGTVSRVDPEQGRVIEVIQVGGSPQSVVYADNRVWVSVDRQTLGGLEPGRYADTLRLSAQKDIDSMTRHSPTGTLMAARGNLREAPQHPDKPAPAGARLIPEVAQALPIRSADGKTYTFTIRKGFRFSPPSREVVTAQTFRHAIERSLNPAMRSGGAQYYLHDVVGAKAYTSGRAAHISGLSVRGDRLTIRLTAPAPDFLLRLAVPFFCAVPLTTPLNPDGVRVIPSAGPYYVTSYIPGQGVILRRNPNYTGWRPHHVERIELSVGVSKQTTDALVEAGTSDYAFSGVDRPTHPTRGEVWRSERSGTTRKAAVLRQPDPYDRIHRPQHSAAPLRRRAPSAGGQLRDQPASPC